MRSLGSFWLTLPFTFILPPQISDFAWNEFPDCDLGFLKGTDSGNCLLAHLLQTLIIGVFAWASSPVLEACALQGQANVFWQSGELATLLKIPSRWLRCKDGNQVAS